MMATYKDNLAHTIIIYYGYPYGYEVLLSYPESALLDFLNTMRALVIMGYPKDYFWHSKIRRSRDVP